MAGKLFPVNSHLVTKVLARPCDHAIVRVVSLASLKLALLILGR
jgi:hypothetical protein